MTFLGLEFSPVGSYLCISAHCSVYRADFSGIFFVCFLFLVTLMCWRVNVLSYTTRARIWAWTLPGVLGEGLVRLARDLGWVESAAVWNRGEKKKAAWSENIKQPQLRSGVLGWSVWTCYGVIVQCLRTQDPPPRNTPRIKEFFYLPFLEEEWTKTKKMGRKESWLKTVFKISS